jgi:integrase
LKNPDWRKEKRKTGGSIKTVNGRIFARIQYIDEATGKRRERLREAPNRTKARELIRDMRDELARGGQSALESDKITFNQIADRYQRIKLVAPVFQNGIKVSGKRSYQDQKYLLKALKDHFANRNIRSIKPSDLEAYKSSRLAAAVVIEKYIKERTSDGGRKKTIRKKIRVERPRSIASVNRELSLLRQIFVFAEAEDLILRNPFGRTKKIISTAAEVQRDRVLSFQEEQLLLTSCEFEARRHIRPIVITAIDTAMRKGELLKLRWTDIDFRQGKITIQATNSKTEKKRIVGMTGRVRSELERLEDLSPKGNTLVFGINSDFKRAWKSATRDAGCSDLHFHDLRHTAITRMIRAGVQISEAMEISGHSEMKTFQRYVNLTAESVIASAKLLDAFNSNSEPIVESSTIA